MQRFGSSSIGDDGRKTQARYDETEDSFFLEGDQTEEGYATAKYAYKNEVYQTRIPIFKMIASLF